MERHLGKREREAGKRHKRRTTVSWQREGKSGSLTLKLGPRKSKKFFRKFYLKGGLPF